jgi:opacity protein-like surface antigen
MRLAALAAVLCFVATAAEAQVCYLYGGMMTCSNGTVGYRYRNSTADPSATYRRNETTPYGDRDSAFYGSETTFSDRRTAYTYGSTTVTADGRTCYRYGSALICNRPHQGLAPSSSFSPPLRTSRGTLQ